MLPPSALPNLFYLLANRGDVPLGRLVRALRYQAALPQGLSASFPQILVGLHDVPSLTLHRVRQIYGKLEEEPLGTLLVDSGRLTPAQLQRVRSELGTAPVGAVPWMLGQGLLSPEQLRALLDELGALAEMAAPESTVQVRLREQGLRLFKRQLWELGLLRQEELAALGLWHQQHVSLKFKPLLDLLVLQGHFPAYLVPWVLREQVSFAQEPLLILAECLQLCPPERVREAATQGVHQSPAFWLTEGLGMERSRLVTAVLGLYRWTLQHQRAAFPTQQNRPRVGAV